MTRRIALLVLAPALLLAHAAHGQESRWAKVRSDGEHFFDDILHVWTAPFRVSGGAVPELLAVSGATLLVGFNDGEIQDWLREHPNSVAVRVLTNFRDSTLISKLGYTSRLIPLSAVLYGAGLLLDADDLREAGIGCATADISNTLARHALARLVGRLRPQYTRDPYVIRPLAFGDWPMRSFPGGHAANIMACTSFWNHRFDLGLAEPALYLLATGIGMGRTLDEAHWSSDTLFGFIFGWAVGRAVADRFLDRDEEAGPEAASAAQQPRPLLYIGWRIPL